MTPRRAMNLAWVVAVLTAVFLALGWVFCAAVCTLGAGLLAGFAVGRADAVPASNVLALLEQWRKDREGYPTGPDGQWANNAVKCCEDELRDVLRKSVER